MFFLFVYNSIARVSNNFKLFLKLCHIYTTDKYQMCVKQFMFLIKLPLLFAESDVLC